MDWAGSRDRIDPARRLYGFRAPACHLLCVCLRSGDHVTIALRSGWCFGRLPLPALCGPRERGGRRDHEASPLGWMQRKVMGRRLSRIGGQEGLCAGRWCLAADPTRHEVAPFQGVIPVKSPRRSE